MFSLRNLTDESCSPDLMVLIYIPDILSVTFSISCVLFFLLLLQKYLIYKSGMIDSSVDDIITDSLEAPPLHVISH